MGTEEDEERGGGGDRGGGSGRGALADPHGGRRGAPADLRGRGRAAPADPRGGRRGAPADPCGRGRGAPTDPHARSNSATGEGIVDPHQRSRLRLIPRELRGKLNPDVHDKASSSYVTPGSIINHSNPDCMPKHVSSGRVNPESSSAPVKKTPADSVRSDETLPGKQLSSGYASDNSSPSYAYRPNIRKTGGSPASVTSTSASENMLEKGIVDPHQRSRLRLIPRELRGKLNPDVHDKASSSYVTPGSIINHSNPDCMPKHVSSGRVNPESSSAPVKKTPADSVRSDETLPGKQLSSGYASDNSSPSYAYRPNIRKTGGSPASVTSTSASDWSKNGLPHGFSNGGSPEGQRFHFNNATRSWKHASYSNQQNTLASSASVASNSAANLLKNGLPHGSSKGVAPEGHRLLSVNANQSVKYASRSNQQKNSQYPGGVACTSDSAINTRHSSGRTNATFLHQSQNWNGHQANNQHKLQQEFQPTAICDGYVKLRDFASSNLLTDVYQVCTGEYCVLTNDVGCELLSSGIQFVLDTYESGFSWQGMFDEGDMVVDRKNKLHIKMRAMFNSSPHFLLCDLRRLVELGIPFLKRGKQLALFVEHLEIFMKITPDLRSDKALRRYIQVLKHHPSFCKLFDFHNLIIGMVSAYVHMGTDDQAKFRCVVAGVKDDISLDKFWDWRNVCSHNWILSEVYKHNPFRLELDNDILSCMIIGRHCEVHGPEKTLIIIPPAPEQNESSAPELSKSQYKGNCQQPRPVRKRQTMPTPVETVYILAKYFGTVISQAIARIMMDLEDFGLESPEYINLPWRAYSREDSDDETVRLNKC